MTAPRLPAFSLAEEPNGFELTAEATRLMGAIANDAPLPTAPSLLAAPVIGTEGDDSLQGSDGDDLIIGLGGIDTMTGGTGDDTYIVDLESDQVVEASGGGTDMVMASVTYRLSAYVENLTLLGSSNLNGFGNALSNTLTGNSGNNRLDGGQGSDVMIGGKGNDTYEVDNAGDIVVEAAGGGTDTVKARVSYSLAANVEKLTLTGTGALSATGNELDNTLTGNAGDNLLDGGLGADTLAGAAGNDTYLVDEAGDVVQELAGGGDDGVLVGFTYTLGNELERLTLTGSASIDGNGNTLANVLTGNAGDNRLDGGAGVDTLLGGLGNDTYLVDDPLDLIVETAGQGYDSVLASVSTTLAAEVEALTLTGTAALTGTGNALNNLLTGNTGANTLDGGVGADTMAGGLGDDTYLIDNIGDAALEQAGEGTDTALASIDYTLAGELERLTLTGTAGLSGTGNSQANTITGNNGANRLDGGAGADTLIGGNGDDTFVIDNAGDTVTEASGGGNDSVLANRSHTLTSFVDNLTLTGTGNFAGTGNALSNALTGNDGNNQLNGQGGDDTLDGSIGADTLIGGAGNDTFTVDQLGDVVTELLDGGTDTVRSAISLTLAANVEKLVLTGVVGLSGTGNALNNTLTGTAADDTLDGSLGGDTLQGGLGNDNYFVDSVGDVVTEAANAGIDGVTANLNWTLAANVENLTLAGISDLNGTGNAVANTVTGNTGNNTLTGLAGADTLDGGAGADTMVGGAGNDTLVVDQTGDVITELLNGGNDTVVSSISYTLAADLENLTLTGSAGLVGNGNSRDNVIVGNEGFDTLSGGDGDDTLSAKFGLIDGGEGNDTLNVLAIEDTGRTSRWIGSDGNTLYSGTSRETIDAALANSETLTLQYQASNGAFYTQASLTNVENLNVLVGNSADDLVFALGNGNRYDGGLGYDTFYADWSTSPSAVNWVSGSGSETVATEGFELVYLATGAGDDSVIDTNRDYRTEYRTAAGNDNATFSFGSIDGGEGSDTLDLATIEDTGRTSRWLGSDGNTLYSGTSRGTIDAALANSETLTLQYQASNGAYYNQASLTNVENLNVLVGNSGDDLVFALGNGNRYDGGVGYDTFYADLSTKPSAVNWVSGSGSETVAAGGFELVYLATGAGDDTVIDTNRDYRTEYRTGAGNDDATFSFGSIDGGEGSDTLDLATIEDTGRTSRWLGSDGNTLYSGTSRGTIDAALANSETLTLQYQASNGAYYNQASLTNVENMNVLVGNSADDLVFALGNGNRYDGGLGYDTFYADWSTKPSAVNWVSGSGSETVAAEGFELVYLATGAGDDTVIDTNRDYRTEYRTAAGNDNATFSFGSIDGGEGTDTLDLATIEDTGRTSRWLGSDGNTLYSGTSRGTIDAALANSETLTLQYQASNGAYYNQASLTNVENLNVLVGNTGSDLVFAQGAGTQYHGGAGIDTLYANWSSATNAITWVNTPDSSKTVNGASVSGLERLIVTTGSGNDRIDNASVTTATNDDIATGAGNDTLNGGLGSDTMAGGTGNDNYFIDSTSSDLVIEAVGAGNDIVQASVSYTLAAEVERLTLTGTTDINGTGNALDNTLKGNSGANSLSGSTGNDTLAGGSGADILNGGIGSDTFNLDSLVGSDTITDFASATDKLGILQSAISVGNGDTVIDGAATISGPGGFSSAAELVVVTGNIAGAITAASASAAIGSASGNFATGQSAIFVVDNGSSLATYYFKALDGDALVSASELSLLATLSSTSNMATTDVVFGV